MTTEDGARPPVARGRAAGVRDREDAVVAGLHRLATVLDDEPAPDFRAASRARLVAMAAVRSPEPPRPGLARRLLRARAGDGPPSRWRTRVTAGLAGAALAVSALGTLVALSADARPGDLLYDVKRGTEQTQLALAGDDRGLTLLQFASTRLDELAAAQDDPELVVQTLSTMDAQTTEGAALLVGAAVVDGDPAPADRLAAWSQRQSAGLAGLRPELPTVTAGAAEASQELLDAVQARAAAVQASLSCPTVPPAAGRDALGPVPGICTAPDPAAPPPAGGAPAAGPDAPGSDAPAAPAPPQQTPVPQPGGGTAGTPGGGAGPGSGSGSGGGPGTGAPSTGAVPAVPPAPLPGPGGGPLPLPPVPGAPGGPSPTPSSPPPLLDTPLPVCVWPLIC
ncbi:hypothetical protein [Trujillonella humicola]|uniref:hypothetical protein n=1 Tax=Trujillonella humicola TaxID=3383699 RepID=UPI0039063A3D